MMRRNQVTAKENKNEFDLRKNKECGRVPQGRREVMGHEMGALGQITQGLTGYGKEESFILPTMGKH